MQDRFFNWVRSRPQPHDGELYSIVYNIAFPSASELLAITKNPVGRHISAYMCVLDGDNVEYRISFSGFSQQSHPFPRWTPKTFDFSPSSRFVNVVRHHPLKISDSPLNGYIISLSFVTDVRMKE